MATGLPVDILLAIFGFLSVHDVLSIRKSCKEFYEVSRSRSLWQSILYTDVISQNIPVPGMIQRPLNTLNSQEIEHAVMRALRLRRNWISASPVFTRKLELSQQAFSARVVSLHFITQRTNQWLLSLSLEAIPGERVFNLQCWDLETSPPSCIASRRIANFGGLTVNQDPSSSEVIAIQSPSIEILTINPNIRHPETAFATSRFFPELQDKIRLFDGVKVLSQDANLRLHHWNLEDARHKIELRNSTTVQLENVLAAHLDRQRVIVVYASILEIYLLPTSQSLSVDMAIEPIAQFKWQWRLDHVVLSAGPVPAAQSKGPRPIDILIRFGSLFPWPINLLHHYKLRPNEYYVEREDNHEDILPYHFPPHFQETIASPVRLFATSDMALGAYGTAIWIDSHTEEYLNHSDSGQRLAGRSLLLFDESDAESAWRGRNLAAFQTTVFDVCEHDTWTRVSLDEGEGRIALGNQDGHITLLEYA